jgi:hypothetical protein
MNCGSSSSITVTNDIQSTTNIGTGGIISFSIYKNNSLILNFKRILIKNLFNNLY